MEDTKIYCPECNGVMYEQYEERAPGYIESVLYCDNCGITEIS